ncbi:MAG: complex I NDUFA9 subunit family protein [Pseudomonadota bacterium]
MTRADSNAPRPRIAVLGGTGFIGRHLLPRLVSDDWEVTVITRSRARHRDLLVMPTVRLVEGDVHDPRVLEQTLPGHTAVVNLVAILNEKGDDGRGFHHVHVELTRKLIAACRASGVGRLGQITALKADAHNGPSHYLRSKGVAEGLLREAHGADLAVTLYQPSVVFGPGDSFINRFADLLRLPAPFMPLPKADARFAPVYVGDVVEAIASSLRDPATYGNTYQLCGPRVYSLREVIRLIADTLEIDKPVLALPDGIARVQAKIMDFLPGKPFSSDNFRSLSVPSVCDADGLGRLGLQPASMESIVPGYLRDAKRTPLDQYRDERPNAD